LHEGIMPRLDLRDLSAFRHVAEAGSITAGAARAHLALAAASTRLRGMETVLGVALLQRGRSGVALTPAGETLLAHARVLLSNADQMHEELSAYAGSVGGHVRSEFLPDVLSRFLASHPGVTVDLQERLSGRGRDWRRRRHRRHWRARNPSIPVGPVRACDVARPCSG
jgi:DNA-binding transcriptional LysR family regulator